MFLVTEFYWTNGTQIKFSPSRKTGSNKFTKYKVYKDPPSLEQEEQPLPPLPLSPPLPPLEQEQQPPSSPDQPLPDQSPPPPMYVVYERSKRVCYRNSSPRIIQ
uniref:Uncharacterized protein n=1 Tax=Rhizophagus irregularis (strain DAOM 181602 / DAOM 197198 / MUCL 43194) TaxID=747089 RepID=U9UYN7_RHIID